MLMVFILRIHVWMKQRQNLEELTHLDVISKGLQVMDSTASSLSMDNDIPLVVFNLNEAGNIRRAILGENIGTTVRGK